MVPAAAGLTRKRAAESESGVCSPTRRKRRSGCGLHANDCFEISRPHRDHAVDDLHRALPRDAARHRDVADRRHHVRQRRAFPCVDVVARGADERSRVSRSAIACTRRPASCSRVRSPSRSSRWWRYGATRTGTAATEVAVNVAGEPAARERALAQLPRGSPDSPARLAAFSRSAAAPSQADRRAPSARARARARA